MARWTFQIRDSVVIGRTPQSSADLNDGRNRWAVWDSPWSEDVRSFGCPMRLKYWGARWCWSIGARSQVWDWNADTWSRKWKRFTVHPRDYRKRYDRRKAAAA